MVQEIVDLIHAEPDPHQRAVLAGAFCHTTRRLRQEVVTQTSYTARMGGAKVADLAYLMGVSNATISGAVARLVRDKNLPAPKRARIDLGDVVTLPPKEG